MKIKFTFSILIKFTVFFQYSLSKYRYTDIYTHTSINYSEVLSSKRKNSGNFI